MSARAQAAATLAAALAALALTACGGVSERREPDLAVRSVEGVAAAEAPREVESGARARSRRLRIAVVTHGQASDPFWAVVNAGVEQAARELGVAITYSAPDTTDMVRMRRLIREAIDTRPDGLVVSIPDAEVLGGAILSASRRNIPVVTINSGTGVSRRLGALAHVGQADRDAGFAAGQRMARAGVRRAACVEHERDNAGLAERCRGFAAALRRAGGRSRSVQIDLQSPAAAADTLGETATKEQLDGMLALGPGGAAPAIEGLRTADLTREVRLATFDLSPEVLDALDRDRLDFAVDQQPFLQGYLPVLFLTQRSRYGLIPARGSLVPTGPSFVTEEDTPRIRRLTAQAIR